MVKRIIFFLLLTALLWPKAGVIAQEEPATVRAVLFFSPTCPHCHFVMNEVLPPLQAEYGAQLDILEIDISQEAGRQLYQTYLVQYQIDESRQGVPALVVGENVLVGSQEIPDLFPTIITANLENGLAWPEINGLEAFLDEIPASTNAEAAPNGLWLAWVGLLGTMGALAFAGWRIIRNPRLQTATPAGQPAWLIPLLAVLGLFISGYLTIVELGQTEAVCGPVGDCNAVQSSTYATIGDVPVALLGMIYYLAVGALWLALPRLRTRLQRPAAWGLTLIALGGVLFSAFLSAVEIFILEAVCAWCVTSSLVSAGILMVVTLAFFPDPAVQRSANRKARRRIAH